jgi:spore coat polysaccharide biosynthesis protein SpsF (cytidylyltransferase family)
LSPIVTIVQARMGSTRLPGKVLRTVGQRPVLHWVIHRIRRTRRFGMVVVATSTLAQDDPIERWCSAEGVPCFRGSESDVLDRYYQCSQVYPATIIMRVTADCPLLDPPMFDVVLDTHLATGADYVSVQRMPKGTAQESLSVAALTEAWHRATLPEEREHVIFYITNRPEHFAVVLLDPPDDLDQPDCRLTLDNADDLVLLNRLFQVTDGELFDLDVVALLPIIRGDPDLRRLARGGP